MSEAPNQQPPSALDDPIDYYIEDMRLHGRSDRTITAYNRVLRAFETHLANNRNTTIPDATRRDCLSWIHELRGSKAQSTIATYATYANRFYGYMVQIGALDANPMTLVIEEMDEAIETDPQRRDITLPRMREFVASITHPLDRAIVVVFLKTGIRVGELSNLDLRDVHLADPGVRSCYGTMARGAIAERPDSLFVPADPARGQEYNGETRTASNKRERSTVIPLDEEASRVLKSWLAVRPDSPSPSRPLFMSTREWGKRVTPAMIRKSVAAYAEAFGWHEPRASRETNVTPHYFRHFFTTHLRNRVGDRGLVKYLRGDVAEDVIDTYTHDWGSQVRDLYLAHVYELFD